MKPCLRRRRDSGVPSPVRSFTPRRNLSPATAADCSGRQVTVCYVAIRCAGRSRACSGYARTAATTFARARRRRGCLSVIATRSSRGSCTRLRSVVDAMQEYIGGLSVFAMPRVYAAGPQARCAGEGRRRSLLRATSSSFAALIERGGPRPWGADRPPPRSVSARAVRRCGRDDQTRVLGDDVERPDLRRPGSGVERSVHVPEAFVDEDLPGGVRRGGTVVPDDGEVP